MEMTKLKITVLPAVVLLTLVSLTSLAWAGDIRGKVTAQGVRSAENTAVYIDSVPGKTFPPPAPHPVMDQLHLAFVPHVLIVLQGTTVDFKNGDAVGHNVYWTAINHNRKLAHNMGTWPQGISKPFTFNDLGDVPLLCNVHQEMSGYIIVVPTPYFALTDKEGSFTIKNIPPGQYTLKTWNADGKPGTQAVTVGAGVANVTLTVTK
jgi:plastocyanin